MGYWSWSATTSSRVYSISRSSMCLVVALVTGGATGSESHLWQTLLLTNPHVFSGGSQKMYDVIGTVRDTSLFTETGFMQSKVYALCLVLNPSLACVTQWQPYLFYLFNITHRDFDFICCQIMSYFDLICAKSWASLDGQSRGVDQDVEVVKKTFQYVMLLRYAWCCDVHVQ